MAPKRSHLSGVIPRGAFASLRQLARRLNAGTCLALALVAPLSGAESMKALRREASSRTRALIFNNDGNEPVYEMKEPTAASLLQTRTAGLAGSHVGTIFYSSWGSGLGLFTHNTKVGQIFDTREGHFARNQTRALLDAGIDPLRVMIEFGRKNNIEVFWSMDFDLEKGVMVGFGIFPCELGPLDV